VTEWYLPFLDASTNTLTLNPWGTWLDQGGAITAFPYGYVTWTAFLPAILLCKALSLPLILGYGLTLMGADLTRFHEQI